VMFELVKKGYAEDDVNIAASVQQYMLLLGFRRKAEVAAGAVIEPYVNSMKMVQEVEKMLKKNSRDDLVRDMREWFYDSVIGIRDASELYHRMIVLVMHVRDRLRKEKRYELADDVKQVLLRNHILIDDGPDSSTYRVDTK
jgi:cysteinyl-tRNA synthetase